MATDAKVVSVDPLNKANDPTWKIQCRMTLMKEGLWGIVNGTENPPEDTAAADVRAKFQARMDKALAIIVLSIDPSLLYLIGDPKDPVTVWKKLSDQFQKMWANKLILRRKRHSLMLKEGDFVQVCSDSPFHINSMYHTSISTYSMYHTSISTYSMITHHSQ